MAGKGPEPNKDPCGRLGVEPENRPADEAEGENRPVAGIGLDDMIVDGAEVVNKPVEGERLDNGLVAVVVSEIRPGSGPRFENSPAGDLDGLENREALSGAEFEEVPVFSRELENNEEGFGGFSAWKRIGLLKIDFEGETSSGPLVS